MPAQSKYRFCPLCGGTLEMKEVPEGMRPYCMDCQSMHTDNYLDGVGPTRGQVGSLIGMMRGMINTMMLLIETMRILQTTSASASEDVPSSPEPSPESSEVPQ